MILTKALSIIATAALIQAVCWCDSSYAKQHPPDVKMRLSDAAESIFRVNSGYSEGQDLVSAFRIEYSRSSVKQKAELEEKYVKLLSEIANGKRLDFAVKLLPAELDLNSPYGYKYRSDNGDNSTVFNSNPKTWPGKTILMRFSPDDIQSSWTKWKDHKMASFLAVVDRASNGYMGRNTTLLFAQVVSDNPLPPVNSLVTAVGRVVSVKTLDTTTGPTSVPQVTYLFSQNAYFQTHLSQNAMRKYAKDILTRENNFSLDEAAIIKSGIEAKEILSGNNLETFSALKANDLNQLEKLLSSGVKVDQVNSDGQTLLMRAAEDNNLSAIDLLIRAGANVNKKTSSLLNRYDSYLNPMLTLMGGGNTALMFSASKGNTAIAKKLIAAGASIGEKNDAGLSAESFAELF